LRRRQSRPKNKKYAARGREPPQWRGEVGSESRGSHSRTKLVARSGRKRKKKMGRAQGTGSHGIMPKKKKKLNKGRAPASL